MSVQVRTVYACKQIIVCFICNNFLYVASYVASYVLTIILWLTTEVFKLNIYVVSYVILFSDLKNAWHTTSCSCGKVVIEIGRILKTNVFVLSSSGKPCTYSYVVSFNTEAESSAC